jgi:hypothetical protein
VLWRGRYFFDAKSAMMIVVEILGAVASIITIFSAGVAAGRILYRKNDRPKSH